MMAGSFSSAEQSLVDKDFRDIRLHMTLIWPSRTSDSEKWLYVEQAMAEAQDRPYRQRIYRVTPGTSERGGVGTLVSEVFELPGGPEGALMYAGAWQTPDSMETLSPEQLSKRDGCDVVLREVVAGTFEGGTVGKACLSSLRGATYVTSKVRMDATGLVTWDQGFDASDKQVWGAVKSGYEFRRVQ